MRASISLADLTESGLVLIDALATLGTLRAPELWEPLRATLSIERAERKRTEGDRQSALFEVPLLAPEQAAFGLGLIVHLLPDMQKIKTEDANGAAIFLCRLGIELQKTLKAARAHAA